MEALKEFEEKLEDYRKELTRKSESIKALGEAMKNGFHWECRLYSSVPEKPEFYWNRQEKSLWAYHKDGEGTWSNTRLNDSPIDVRLEFYDVMDQFIKKASSLIPEMEGNR